MGGIGWMVEDHLVEIVNLWRRHLARELPGVTEPALGYAVPVFLRELSRCLRDDAAASANPFRRCELLLKVAPGEGPAGLVHEFRLLRRAIWEVLRAHGRLVPPQERTVADGKIDEAMAAAVARLVEHPREREARLRRGGGEPGARRPRGAEAGRMAPLLPKPGAAPVETARVPVTRFAPPPRPPAGAPPPLPVAAAEPMPEA
jgi:hypothetical protein